MSASRIGPSQTPPLFHFGLILAGLVLAGLIVPGVASAQSSVPGKVNFQGVLLDVDGAPLIGPVDLIFTLYNAPVEGDSVWTESHDGVVLRDGIYEVALGTFTPLPPALLENAPLSLEVTVDAEVLDPRIPLLAVPYAIKAQQAEVATVARELIGLNEAQVNYFATVYEFANNDGGGPRDSDPLEGLADLDGDGTPNAFDRDNDGDGRTDAEEIESGTNINVADLAPPQPSILFVVPSRAEPGVSFDLKIIGQDLRAGSVVRVGGGEFTPTEITEGFANQSAVTVPITTPEIPGDYELVVVLPDGSSATRPFDVGPLVPSLYTDDSGRPLNFPSAARFDGSTTVTLLMNNVFEPYQIQFGSETPAPGEVEHLDGAFGNFSSFKVVVGPQPRGEVNVTVTNPSGETGSFVYLFDDTRQAFLTSTLYSASEIGGVSGADEKCAAAAAAGEIQGTFLAWIADGDTDPASRFSGEGGPYRVPGQFGGVVALDFDDLLDGELISFFGNDEFGERARDAIPFPNSAWTNVSPDGTRKGDDDCADWTSDEGLGAVGTFTSDASWTDAGTNSCAARNRLYCFEQ